MRFGELLSCFLLFVWYSECMWWVTAAELWDTLLIQPGLFQSRVSAVRLRESTKPCPVVCADAWMICPKQAGWCWGRDTPALSTPSSSFLCPMENPSCTPGKTIKQQRFDGAFFWEPWSYLIIFYSSALQLHGSLPTLPILVKKRF